MFETGIHQVTLDQSKADSTPARRVFPRSILIIEEQLNGEHGHHFGQMMDVAGCARRAGSRVNILCNRTAPANITNPLQAEPRLDGISPASMGLNVGRLKRPFLITLGTIKNALTIFRFLQKNGRQDLVLVPTAWIPHVISLFPVALFCPHLMGAIRLQFLCRWNPAQKRSLWNLKILRCLLRLLGKLHPDLKMFGQTPLVCEDIRGTSSLSVTWAPDVAHPTSNLVRKHQSASEPVVFGFYGFARHEQGTDILQEAIKRFLQKYPKENVLFRIVWPCGKFELPDGTWVGPDENLEKTGKVVYYREILSKEEAMSLLDQTDWLMVPYRAASYKRRSSLLATDAISRGIPAIYTAGTFLEQLFNQFGAGIAVPDAAPDALAAVFGQAISGNSQYQSDAAARRKPAVAFFSAESFWEKMIGPQPA